MAYRDDDGELLRRASLLRDRAERSSAGDEVAVEAIDEEVARLDASRRDALRRHLPLVASARIASPCAESWDAMVGTESARTCARCEKEVFDLSVLTVHQAEALLRSRVGKPTCARLYVRADGTMMFADCSVGARGRLALRVTLAASAVVVAATALALAAPHRSAARCTRALRYSSYGEQDRGGMLMGEMVAPSGPTAPGTPAAFVEPSEPAAPLDPAS